MRFLIVDDAETPLKCLQRLLGDLGHEVTGIARDGVDAVRAYRQLRPDVVILDVIMPRMNGLDALRAIRAEDPDARVIMASSLRSCQTALEAEKLGALYCLSKPYDECRLRKVVECIDARRAHAAAESRGLGRAVSAERYPA